jgi:hypothetical protein
MAKSLVHQKTAAELDGAGEQITLRLLVSNAKRLIAGLAAAEVRLLSMRNEILDRAWQLGKMLTAIKQQVGRGNWYIWLAANLPELGSTEGTRQGNAARCMRLYGDNSDRRNSCGGFRPDTVRKFMWGYIPAKERLQLEGDEDIKPGPHHLIFVNQFSKYDRQLRSGQVEGFSVDIFRREVEPMLRRIADLCGRDWFRKLGE